MVARAILDDKILNLPLHPIFWSLLLQRPIKLSDIKSLDPEFYSSIISLYNLNFSSNKEDINLLELEFILPGYPEHKLINKNKEQFVTS